MKQYSVIVALVLLAGCTSPLRPSPSPLPNLVQLRGTMNLTVNGQPSGGRIHLYASRNMDTIDGYIGNLWGIIEDDGTWTYYVNPQKLSRRSDPVWFFIYPPFTLGAEEVILSRSVDWNAVVYDGTISQHPVITGIDLGSHNFSAVTVSCSGGNLTVDGAPPYMAQITVMRVVDGREGVMWIETSDRVTGRQNPLNMGTFTFDAAFPFRPGTILRLQFRLLRNSYSSTEERLYNLDFDPQAVLANPVITWPDIDIAF